MTSVEGEKRELIIFADLSRRQRECLQNGRWKWLPEERLAVGEEVW